MWSHLESKLSGILCAAFVAMFEENPGVKEKFYSGIGSGAGSDVGMAKNGEQRVLASKFAWQSVTYEPTSHPQF